MKKIIISLTIIAAVGAIVVGGTVAFFSDTETSSGNTFTAGAIDLKIDSTCTYNGDTQDFCTWASKDLEAGNVFFNFDDVKPGDSGEDTISFDLTSNPAWACAVVSGIIDSDNGCNDPEKEAETGCIDDGDGELDENLYVTAWVDDGAGSGGIACDNIINGDEEIIVDDEPVSQYLVPVGGSDKVVIPVADNSDESLMGKGVSLQPGTHCIGISWNVPTGTGNEVQTDKLSADLEFYVEQTRNNPTFTCLLK